MMCCDALYCTNLKSIGILLTILTSWHEVLPHAEDNKGIVQATIQEKLHFVNSDKF